MKTRQTALQTENAELLARVMQQRKDISAMVQGLENVVADLDASVGALAEEDIDAMREEARDVDERMETGA